MRQTYAELVNTVNTTLTDNAPDQDIEASDLNQVFQNFNDSLVNKSERFEYKPFIILTSHLDAQKKYILNHSLGSKNIKVVMYNKEGFKLHREFFTTRYVDDDNIEFTFIGGIPVNDRMVGVVYKIV